MCSNISAEMLVKQDRFSLLHLLDADAFAHCANYFVKLTPGANVIKLLWYFFMVNDHGKKPTISRVQILR